MLSPENYIRKKARSPPIFECLVNTGWQENGVAHVIVARNHTNGNITACMYMVDIECGKDGKPFYVSGPFDDQVKINKVMAQLEKIAGPGNYDYLLGDVDEFEGNDLDDEETEETEEDKFKSLSIDEKKKILLDMRSRMKNPKEADTKRFFNLSKSIFNEFVDPALFHQYLDEYIDDLNIEINNGKLPDEMLGIDSESTIISDTARSMFLEISKLIQEKPKKASKLLEGFRKQTPDIPASYYLELLILQDKKQNKYLKKLEEYSNKFPDYPLIKILWEEEHILPESLTKDENAEKYKLNSFFPGRNSLHEFEIFKYLMFQILILGDNENVSRLEAFYDAYAEIDLPDEDSNILDSLVLLAKMRFALKFLIQKQYDN